MDEEQGIITSSSRPRFKRSTIFRKILIFFVVFSLVPVGFASFLTISTYQGVLDNVEHNKTVSSDDIGRLRQNILIQIFLILFLLIILIVFASILVARSITRPLSALVQGVKEVSRGNLDINFRIHSKDELGELAAAFNEMIAKLKEQREREFLVSKLKTEFISIAAHQLRTPLSSIKWIMKMLLDGDLGAVSPKQREFVEKGYLANERMINLVNDLLDASRIEEGRFGFEFKNADFTKFMQDLINSFTEGVKSAKIEFVYNPPSGPIILFFDPQRLRMALHNLIDNAIHYTSSPGRVIVTVKEEESNVEVSVSDTGVGIPKDQQGRIFTKFFRGDNVIRMQTEGTGMGLYISKNIVERHGGKMWFDSDEGRGTTFFLSLPKKKGNVPQ